MFYRKQTHKNSCGYDAAAILLANLMRSEDYIHDNVPLGPASFLDILTFLKAKGVTARAMRVSSARQLTSAFWYIAHQPDGNGHFVVIKVRFNKRQFVILDPALGIYALNQTQLMTAIDGNIIAVEIYKKVKNGKDALPPKKHFLALMGMLFFQLSTVTALVIALYLINDGNDYLISIGLLILAMLFYLYEKIYRIHNLFANAKKDKYTQFAKCIRNSTRKSEFLLQIITKVLMVIFSLGLILYNNLFLGLISLAFLSVVAVAAAIYYPSGKTILDIKKLENQMEKNNKVSSSQLKQLQKKAELLTFKKSVSILAKELIPLLIVILMLIVENKARLNYAIFYFFLVRFSFQELWQLIYFLKNNNSINLTL
ncbi:MAG TPA: cysteine peptidase family C39 domain-containing protein [Bacilli bacterium]|nr:cysteine peptidase family C39 domain-containing protein [Bacilli bacterium]